MRFSVTIQDALFARRRSGSRAAPWVQIASLALVAWIGAPAHLGAAPDPSPAATPAATGEAKQDEKAKLPRLVILYAPCSVDKLHLGPYREEVAYTPALTAFARDALVFERHQTEAGLSGTAYAALFSGEQANRHGILKHPAVLDEGLYTITEAFADAGYDAYAWLNHLMASRSFNYAQGVPPKQTTKRLLEAKDPTFIGILDRLKSDPTYRAFILVDFTVTHTPYAARRLDEFCRRFPRDCAARNDAASFEKYRKIFSENFLPLAMNHPNAVAELKLSSEDVRKMAEVVEVLYKASIFQLDELFGSILAAIDSRGLADEGLIAFTADHGEILYRDNAALPWSHGHQLAPEYLGVPLLVRGKSAGVRAGRYPGVTRSVDVYPTLAGLSGVEPEPKPTGGVDLSASVRGETAPPELLAYSHSALYPGRIKKYPHLMELLGDNKPADLTVAVRRGDELWKLHRGRGGAWEGAYFDLAADPTERRNLFDAAKPEHQKRLEDLRRYKDGILASREKARAERVSRDKAEKLLRAMGYIE